MPGGLWRAPEKGGGDQGAQLTKPKPTTHACRSPSQKPSPVAAASSMFLTEQFDGSGLEKIFAQKSEKTIPAHTPSQKHKSALFALVELTSPLNFELMICKGLSQGTEQPITDRSTEGQEHRSFL